MCTKSKKVPAFFWSVLRYYIPSFKKKYEKLHKRATVYSCFLHMCFLWVIFIPNFHPFPNVVVHDAFYKIKKTASNAAFLGEGIFTMGYSKNYIMYWGVFTVIIIPWTHAKVCTNLTKSMTRFWLFCISENKIKKTASNAVFLGEGIFTMGYSKNYIMYWGVFTVIIIPWTAG